MCGTFEGALCRNNADPSTRRVCAVTQNAYALADIYNSTSPIFAQQVLVLKTYLEVKNNFDVMDCGYELEARKQDGGFRSFLDDERRLHISDPVS